MARTNIVIDDGLIESGLSETGLKTRRALVDHALRELIRHKRQKKILDLRGKIDCIIAATAIESGVELLHNDRDFDHIAAYGTLSVYSR